jgi:hypothetical protein
MSIRESRTPSQWRDAYLTALRAAGHHVTWQKSVVHGNPGYHLTCISCGGELRICDQWSSTVRGRPALTLFGNIKRCPQRGKRHR